MDTSTLTSPAIYQDIPLERIRPSAHQARKDFDPAALQGLADSMKAEGLLEPIIVRPIGEGKGEKSEISQGSTPRSLQPSPTYELISGERRLRAAKLLGWKTIETKIIQTVSDAEAAAKGLVENLQRQDLNPIEEAEGFQELNQLDKGYWTQEKIAQVAGKGHNYVSQALGLLKLPDSVRDYSRRRELGRSHALELLALSDSKQIEQVVAMVVKEELSIKQTRQLVAKLLGKPPKATRADGRSQNSERRGFTLSRKGETLHIQGSFPANTPDDDILKELQEALQPQFRSPNNPSATYVDFTGMSPEQIEAYAQTMQAKIDAKAKESAAKTEAAYAAVQAEVERDNEVFK